MRPDTHQAVNPIPPIIMILCLIIVAVEIVLSAGAQGWVGGPTAIGWRSIAIQDYGVNGLIVEWLWQNHRFPPEHILRFVSYSFVHGNITHAVFAAVLLLALGKFVAERFRAWAVLIVFFVPAILGAIGFGVFLTDPTWLIGAFPGIYGLIGAFTYIMWHSLAARGAEQWRAFALIGFLLGIQLLFAVLFGTNNEWIADIIGFATGFGLSIFVSPGGWAAFVWRIRQLGSERD